MDSTYTSHAVRTQLINSRSTAQSCMCREIQEGPKALHTLAAVAHTNPPDMRPPTAAGGWRRRLDGASRHGPRRLCPRRRDGAIRQTRSSFAKPSRWVPRQYKRLIGRGVPRGSGPRATTCAARPARCGRSDRDGTRCPDPATTGNPGSRNPIWGQVVGLSPASPARVMWVHLLGSLLAPPASRRWGEALEFKARVTTATASIKRGPREVKSRRARPTVRQSAAPISDRHDTCPRRPLALANKAIGNGQSHHRRCAPARTRR
jgi:hypothetical protein